MFLEYQHIPVCGMNYLETGLPHTDFCRRKSDFSPPRYIPLCGGLGRKYLGLEPLTKREMGVLVRRLSEPKKSADCEEQITLLPQVRRRSAPGSGRFVGQKKMSSFEIEKMVDRLYSRRVTKDYAFVDETVEANDILNMTSRLDGASDSEDEETKVVKNRENYLLRRQSSVRVNVEQEMKRSPVMRSESTNTTVHELSKSGKSRVLTEVKDPAESQLQKVDNKPRLSVSFQRPKSLIDYRIKVNEYQQYTDKNVFKSIECSVLPESDIKRSPVPPAPRRCKSETVNLEKVDEGKKSNALQTYVNFPRSYTAELTRPSPSKAEIPLLVGIENAPFSADLGASVTKSDPATTEHTEKKCEISRPQKKYDSPRQKNSKSEDSKSARYTVAPCDELLIDRVATYNRSPRLPCK